MTVPSYKRLLMQGRWNLDDKRFRSISLFQITYIKGAIPESESDGLKRLLILSHQIASRGTPAIFKRKSPELSPKQDTEASILVFDIMEPFESFELPLWAMVSETWTVSATDKLNTEFMEDLEQALALILVYKYTEHDPLYFTNFVLITSTEECPLPVICKMVPVVREDSFMIRNIVQGDLKIVVNYPGSLKRNDVILVPPHPHPFIITEVNDKHIETRNISGFTKTFADQESFVLLCNPPENIYNLKARETRRNGIIPENVSATRGSYMTDPRTAFQFATKEFFSFNKDNVNDSAYTRAERGDSDTELVFEPKDFSEIIDEELDDSDVSEAIKRIMGNEPPFPSPFTYFELALSSFVSFFNFDLSCCPIQQPCYARRFAVETPIEGIRTGIPDVVVRVDETVESFPANAIMEAWEDKHVLPISGEKTAPYVVFYFDSIEKNDVMDFFECLRTSFVDHEFGDLKPFRHDNAYMKVTYANFDSYIREFFKNYSSSEFQQTPILTYIVCPRGFTKAPDVHSVCTLIPEDLIRACEVSDIDHAAFITYSRIRRFDSAPYGVIDVPPEAASLLFGYRYQAPYMLKRQDESEQVVTFHICWDPARNMTSWIDDIGAVSNIFKGRVLEMVCKQINQLGNLLKNQRKRVTICVLGESMSTSMVREIVTVFQELHGEFSLFGVHPMANIQASFDEHFDDDIVVFSAQERTFCNGLSDNAVPDSTCYVLSPEHTAYSISHYYNNVGEDPTTHLEKYAQKMSHWSWLAVRCSDNKRITSFPPHVASLLPKKMMETISVSPFEFLSSHPQSAH